MDSIDIFLDLANVIQFVAVILLMRAIIKDRKVIRGISVTGSFMNFIAIFCFEVVFVLLKNYVSVALGLVGLTFWFITFLFTFTIRFTERKHQVKLIK